MGALVGGFTHVQNVCSGVSNVSQSSVMRSCTQECGLGKVWHAHNSVDGKECGVWVQEGLAMKGMGTLFNPLTLPSAWRKRHFCGTDHLAGV